MPRSELSRSHRLTAPWAVAAIVVFVVVDAVLVWWAIASVRTEPGVPQEEVLPTIPPLPTTTADASDADADATAEGATPPGTGSSAPTRATATRPTVVIAALDASTAYRGTTGTCPGGGATIELTVDGGATWSAGVTEGLTDLQSVEAVDADIVTMVARDAACAIGRYHSYVQGIDWELTGELEPTWYADGEQAIAPTGASTPCGGPIVQLAATSVASAAVVCKSGGVLTTADAGASWAEAATASGAIAIAARPTGYLVAVTGDGCRGIRIAAIDTAASGSPSTPGACLESDAAPGDIAIDVAPDGTVWAWTGGVLARSADGGATW
ncbi:hypothetical protein SAMN05428970_1317 [Agromyces sp. CF514]|uniref:hypothetical protein n=1 Tax=Agromyces sp. CF514 TaxID=1881031 RepID=UPI0008F3F28F|nr:hypothetical protein [Agromyces sp. CF514]SFR72177.1 hypothetical protein SAMN05428970_1317 [Agromyces sp. CF514]